ncbi:MAG: SixA phosphatase family protein [Chitinophagaceae bacterium]
MKILLLIRHAKSESKEPWQTDFDRALSERGLRDAPEMAQKVIQKKIRPQLLISSPALRAKTTAQLMAREWKIPENQILMRPQLYEAQVSVFQDLVAQLDACWESVAFFAHNPGLTQFACSLGGKEVDHLPTCGIFGLRLDTSDWGKFKQAKKEMLIFDYPGRSRQ